MYNVSKENIKENKQKNGVHGHREANIKMMMQKKKDRLLFFFSKYKANRGKKYRFY